MRERDRRTYTVVWMAVTAVGAAILIVAGSPASALLVLAVAVTGLVAFLRTTHPRGPAKPNLAIFFDGRDLEADTPAHEAAAPTAVAGAEPDDDEAVGGPDAEDDVPVIDLRQAPRADAAAGVTVGHAVAASDRAAVAAESSQELAAHHVRLLRQVQVQLQDYE